MNPPTRGSWSVDVLPDGRYVVTHAGDPDIDVRWLRHTIHAAQACDALALTKPPPRPAKGDIDPGVRQLHEARLEAGISVNAIRRVLLTRVDQYERGECQPPVGTFRSWAWLLDFEVSLVKRGAS